MQLVTFDPETKHHGLIQQPPYGTECWFAVATAESSNSSTSTWATKAILSVTVQGGWYRISWRHSWRMSAADRHFKWRLRQNSSTVADSNERYMNTTESRNDSGFVMVNLTAGTYTFSAEFQPASAVAYMSGAYLEVVRIS